MSDPEVSPEGNPAATDGLDGLFRPRSVAVIGASRRRGTIGRDLLHNLIVGEFEGPIFPVNPGTTVVHSLKCYPSVLAIPDPVDLAIIVVPRGEVLRVVDECGNKGVKGVVVISSGFREVGEVGVVREQELLRVVRRYGMRMIGPNCMGILNTDPAVRLDATFSPTGAQRGDIGFLSQSGAMGVAILNHARNLGLGFSMFASMGNKADVSGNDLLLYWENDPDTRLILMYLESFGNPRHFIPIARRITRRKPVLAVKSGRTQEGARAAASHTGALAGPDAAVDSLLAQCGVLRASSVEDLFDMALAFDSQPVPRGNRVAILTDAGGPAIMAVDALGAAGLRLATLSETTRAALASDLSPDASVVNPVDMLGHASGADYDRCLRLLLEDDGVDAIVTLYVPPVMHEPVEVIRSIFEVVRKRNGGGEGSKPVLCVFMAREEILDAVQRIPEGRLPVYRFPESAVRALGSLARYGRLRDLPEGTVPVLDVDRSVAETVLRGAAAEGREHLTLDEVRRVLEAYGIQFARSRRVARREDLADAMEALGAPLVMKIDSADIVHKTEVGGVVTDLRTIEEALAAFDGMMNRAKAIEPAPRVDGVLLQEMRRGAQEMILGIATDPVFGPLLMAGVGGVTVEIAQDVAFRVVPITTEDADEMIDSLRGVRLLEAFRGRAPLHRDALRDALLRLGRLVEDFHGIVEADINPFMVAPTAEASMAVDGRIRINPAAFR